MSIAEFSSALKARIFTDWLDLDTLENPVVASNIYAKLTKLINTTGVSSLKLQYTISDSDNEKEVSNILPKLFSKLQSDITKNSIAEQLLTTRSSPSFVDLLRQGLIKALEGKKAEVVNLSSPKVKIHSKPQNKQIRDSKGRFYSLALLKELINASLPHVLSANMGPYFGKQRKILNFRTGRFSTSAVVERLTQSKEGMITAFYSYMKYPYATFSKGGEQYIPSRDPKLLIVKSIKEIAATKVSARMRSVNV